MPRVTCTNHDPQHQSGIKTRMRFVISCCTPVSARWYPVSNGGVCRRGLIAISEHRHLRSDIKSPIFSRPVSPLSVGRIALLRYTKHSCTDHHFLDKSCIYRNFSSLVLFRVSGTVCYARVRASYTIGGLRSERRESASWLTRSSSTCERFHFSPFANAKNRVLLPKR